MGDEKEMRKKVGKNISLIRGKRGISQSELATSANIEKSTLGHIEIGTRNPTIKTLFKIAKALNVTLYELVKYK